LIGCFFILANYCYAQALEVDYPTLPGGETLNGDGIKLPNYLLYLYNFGFWFGFIIAILSLAIAGILYILSNAIPSLKATAKDRVYGAITGFILLLLIYLIITTINPNLRIFRITTQLDNQPPVLPPQLAIAGVYFYGENGCPDPQPMAQTMNIADLEDLKNRVKSIKIVHNSASNVWYIAILHDIINFQGRCEYFSYGSCQPPRIIPTEAASASIYRYNFNPSGGGITFYRKSSHNTGGGWRKIENINGILILKLEDLKFTGNTDNENQCNVPENEQDCIKWEIDGKTCKKENRKCPNLMGENITSIKIDGDYIVILIYYDGTTRSEYIWNSCQIFPTPDDINEEGPRQIKWEYIRNEKYFYNLAVIIPVKQK